MAIKKETQMRKPSEVESAAVSRTPAPAVAAATWARELFWAADALSARSVQAHIGPSEVGDPCDRAVASKVQGLPPLRVSGGSLASIAGTGIHDWIAQRLADLYGNTARYLVETRVEYRGISGTSDLYDRRLRRVVDWKTVSQSKLARIRRSPEFTPQWRVQTAIYAAGMEARGESVEEVSIVLVPREGSIDDIFALTMPFDRSIADAAIDRVERLRETDVSTLGTCSGPFCDYCPTPGT